MDRRVKVLFIPDWYPPKSNLWAAHGTFCREHVHAAARFDDVAVLVFTMTRTRWPFWRVERIDDNGVPTWYVTTGRSPIPGTSPPILHYYFRRAVRLVVREWGKPEVIHTQDSIAYRAMKHTADLGAPYVISQHWTAFLRREIPSFLIPEFRSAFARAYRVLPTSYRAEDDYAHYDIQASVRWLPNALNADIFTPDPPGPREPWLLHVSGFSAQKRVPDILRAFAIVHRQCPDAVLHFVGDSAARPMMEAEAARLLPAHAYRFHGFLPKPQLADLMRRSSGFVFPSAFETFGCVLMEAMACGCPVLTTRAGGIPAVVREDEHEGLLVEVGDIEAIAAGMISLLDGTHGIDAEQVSRTVRARFSHDAVGSILHQEHLGAAGG